MRCVFTSIRKSHSSLPQLVTEEYSDGKYLIQEVEVQTEWISLKNYSVENGASKGSRDGKMCQYCGKEIDLEKHDWVIREYKV